MRETQILDPYEPPPPGHLSVNKLLKIMLSLPFLKKKYKRWDKS